MAQQVTATIQFKQLWSCLEVRRCRVRSAQVADNIEECQRTNTVEHLHKSNSSPTNLQTGKIDTCLPSKELELPAHKKNTGRLLAFQRCEIPSFVDKLARVMTSQLIRLIA